MLRSLLFAFVESWKKGGKKNMKERIYTNGDRMIVYTPKEVDHCFADSMREMVDRKLQLENIKILEFDFENTEFMDSSGIGLLMGRYKLMRALGGR